MAATARVEASIRRALVEIANGGVPRVTAKSVAEKAGIKRKTVMRFGRESMPIDLGRWRAFYDGGTFVIVEAQTGVVMW